MPGASREHGRVGEIAEIDVADRTAQPRLTTRERLQAVDQPVQGTAPRTR